MAVLMSRLTGLWLTPTTWGVIDNPSFNASETTTTVVTTAFSGSVGTTTGAITVEGLAFKLSARTGVSGTMSAHLAVAAVEVPGTLVTIDVADLPASATVDLNGGWVYFKFAAPVTLAAATSYVAEAMTSVAGQVSLFATATNNWSRALVTSVNQVPAAGDSVIVTGDYISPGVGNNITVTMNALESAITDYGNGTIGLLTPAVSVCSRGTLSYGVAAATNYYLRLSGNAIVYSGGTFNIGTVAAPIPRDSTAKLNFDCAGNVDHGLLVRNLGTLVMQGLSRTAGKNVVSCKLNADAAVNALSLGVNADTGWLDNDLIGVAATSRTAAHCEAGALNGNATATTLPVDGFAGAGGGLANAHSGYLGAEADTRAEVVLLTRNVQLFGASATQQAYLAINNAAAVDCDWAEFRWMGSATAQRRGIDVGTVTGSATFAYCSRHSSTVASSVGFSLSGSVTTTTPATLAFQNCVSFDVANNHFVNVATTGTWIIDSCVFAKNSDASTHLVSLGDVGGTFTNNTMAGATSSGLNLIESQGVPGNFSGNTIHSNASAGINVQSSIVNGTISATACWRNAGVGLNLSTPSNLAFDGGTFFGNTATNILSAGTLSDCAFRNLVVASDSTFLTASGYSTSTNQVCADIVFENCTFGVASGILAAHTQDIAGTPSYETVTLKYCLLASPVEVAAQTNMSVGSYVRSHNHDQTAGNHRSWGKYGTLTSDTTLFSAASPSVRMAPAVAGSRLSLDLDAADGKGAHRVPVDTARPVTVSVQVRRSVAGDGTAYTGAPPRLILRKNFAAGVPADLVLATASGPPGTWETLTGVTPGATSAGVFSFVVDCEGNAGWVNVDDWKDRGGSDSHGVKFWNDGIPFSTGGGGGAGSRKHHVGPRSQ